MGWWHWWRRTQQWSNRIIRSNNEPKSYQHWSHSTKRVLRHWRSAKSSQLAIPSPDMLLPLHSIREAYPTQALARLSKAHGPSGGQEVRKARERRRRRHGTRLYATMDLQHRRDARWRLEGRNTQQDNWEIRCRWWPVDKNQVSLELQSELRFLCSRPWSIHLRVQRRYRFVHVRSPWHWDGLHMATLQEDSSRNGNRTDKQSSLLHHWRGMPLHSWRNRQLICRGIQRWKLIESGRGRQSRSWPWGSQDKGIAWFWRSIRVPSNTHPGLEWYHTANLDQRWHCQRRCQSRTLCECPRWLGRSYVRERHRQVQVKKLACKICRRVWSFRQELHLWRALVARRWSIGGVSLRDIQQSRRR